MNKSQKNRWLYSLKYQFGTIKVTDKAKELYNKELNDLNEAEINNIFEVFYAKYDS
jgi:hypothetical protein